MLNAGQSFGRECSRRAHRWGSFDYSGFAQLNVPGGVIRNIALQAAFFAAEEGQPIGMKHILEGARSEYGKLERSLTPAEIRGWL